MFLLTSLYILNNNIKSNLKRHSSVQSLSCVQLFATPWTATRQASLSITKSLEFTQTHVHWVGDAIQPSYLLSSPSPPAFNLSQHQGFFKWSQLFASGGQSTGVSASTSVLPMNTQDWLISFRVDWLDLLAVQGTIKSLLQHHSSKAPILWHSAFLQSKSHIHTWSLEKP